MKILLVTRGSQGDIYPYLTVASALMRRGHEITMNLPAEFEKQANDFGVNYVLQKMDNIEEMINQAAKTKQKTGHLLKWMRRVIDIQFEELIPLLQQHDLIIASNTEFSAVSVAEYCKKPIIRTAFGPFIPGKSIPPPAIPFPKPHPVFKPALLWKILNLSTNFMVKKTINKNRIARGMPPIVNFGIHSVRNSKNFLLYSRHLGSTDTDWECDWDIGGYCFNDSLYYPEKAYQEFMEFIRKNKRKTLFFTLGSCNDDNRNNFCENLLAICNKHNYKLIVGSGWSGTGTHLKQEDTLYILKEAIPHSLIFPHCTAIVHHGGCGTTHSAARAGLPQMIVPLILDQPYWSYRVSETGVGGRKISIKTSLPVLEKSILDLVNNPDYQTHATQLKNKLAEENGSENFCRYIETHFGDLKTTGNYQKEIV